MRRAPTPEGVLAASNRIRGEVLETPLLPIDLGEERIWIKAESLQRSGSFKIRGAFNRLLQLSDEEKAQGVVAFSSGNHAQAVALAANQLGVDALIVMPSDAPAVKRAATLAAGACIHDYDRHSESRVEIATRIAAERGAVLVPSFDDPDIIEGQGSIGAELARQMSDVADEVPALVVVPCGGGGLAAGIALALPGAEIVIVEPQGWDDMARSLAVGRIVPVDENAPSTRCDALQTPLVSPLTFEVLVRARARGVSVSEEEVAYAVAFAMRHLRLVVEPGGAVALAALLSSKLGPVRPGTVIVISGGNVDPALYAGILESQAAELTR